ncbi:MAG: response regulator [Candidatus Omnitrophica bacterium]|nr:response regulator [Candidatus Omnitrophota bacterium]
MDDMIKVLIVDDEADVCGFAKSFFEARGLSVFTAINGEEGLGVFSREKPDIVVIDVRMHGMDGIAFLKEIKKINKDVEAIMVSAVEDADVIQEAKRHGASRYITKPLVLEELENVVLEKAKWIKSQKKV